VRYKFYTSAAAAMRGPILYLAFTLEVIDAITPEAVLNGAWSVSLMPWRRAIQRKSV
jgi:hypothetical protein